MFDTDTINAQIDALLAAGHAAVNIAVNIDARTHDTPWGEVIALPAEQMARALVAAFGREYRANGQHPTDAAADEVAVMMDADEFRAAYC